VTLDDRDALAGTGRTDPAADWEGRIHLEGRSVLRIVLRGRPGDGIILCICGEAGKVHASCTVGNPSSVRLSPNQAGSVRAPEWPQPSVALKANVDTIEIGLLATIQARRMTD
jgi:hypothetical protein